MVSQMTWKELVVAALVELGGEATLVELTKKLEKHPHRPQTTTWQATIRRVVRQYKIFEPFKTNNGQAAYRLVEIPAVSKFERLKKKDLHGEQQGMLLQLGRLCGYETFTNSTDRTIRKMGDSSIAQFATVRNDTESIKGLPLEKFRTIDVMWLSEDTEGLYPKYAFEVEESTKVKNGLLRLLRIPFRYHTGLYIIGKDDEEEKLFKKYMTETPFREHWSRIHFQRYEKVASFYESALDFGINRKTFGIELNINR